MAAPDDFDIDAQIVDDIARQWDDPDNVSAAGPISLALSPATITVTGQADGVTVGAVTVAQSPATITVTAQTQTLTSTMSIALSPATITVTAQADGVTVGGASVALTPATITVTAQANARTLGGISVAQSPATVTVTGQAHGLTVGGTASVALTPATVTVTPSTLGIAGVTPPVVTTPEEPTGGGYEVSRATRAQWRKERQEYEDAQAYAELLEQEDDEILVLL